VTVAAGTPFTGNQNPVTAIDSICRGNIGKSSAALAPAPVTRLFYLGKMLRGVDHFEPRDPQLIEDGVDGKKWVDSAQRTNLSNQ
jgi:hypothetical protein